MRAERGEIWFVNDVQGFYVVRFEDGIWPFKDSPRCPEFDDYYFAHYNPGSTCPTANFNGIGKPAPQALARRGTACRGGLGSPAPACAARASAPSGSGARGPRSSGGPGRPPAGAERACSAGACAAAGT